MPEASTRTVERALDLLAAICDAGAITLSESARATGLSPSTALRLLRTLQASGFVRRGESGEYRPGSRMIQLGAQALSSESLVSLAKDAMHALVAQTGESVYLSIEGYDDTALYIAVLEGTHSVRHTNWVGRTIALEASAVGRVLRGHTASGGFMVVDRGVEPDVTAIAAPIHSHDNVVAALSLVIPSYRVTADERERFGRLLVDAASDVSVRLGQPGAHTIAPSTETRKGTP